MWIMFPMMMLALAYPDDAGTSVPSNWARGDLDLVHAFALEDTKI